MSPQERYNTKDTNDIEIKKTESICTKLFENTDWERQAVNDIKK